MNRIAPATSKVILLGTLASLIAMVACSQQAKPKLTSSEPLGSQVRPAVLQTGEPVVEQVAPVVVSKKTTSNVKPSAAKTFLYRSRDYGISFEYPWQYAFVSAKAIANGDDSLKPKSDGNDGQFTLARVDIPKGFYSDTDFQSGYFAISLNHELTEEQCSAVLTPSADGKLDSATINDVEFRRTESDSGGHGEANRVRQYVTFTNGVCYELELGVKTSNDKGLVREVNSDQVMRRLDAMLRTVKIQVTAPQKPVPAVAEDPTETAPEAQKSAAPEAAKNTEPEAPKN